MLFDLAYAGYTSYLKHVYIITIASKTETFNVRTMKYRKQFEICV